MTKKIEDCGLASLQSSAGVGVIVGTVDSVNITPLEEELQHKFTQKKYQNMQLASDYYVLGSMDSKFASRIDRVSQCGTMLKFGINEKGEHKLIHANFCRDLMCPQCNWRRSLRMFGEVSACMDILESKYTFLFATFTIKNCDAANLKNTCSTLQKSLTKMLRVKLLKSVIKGFFWALEVTYNPIDKTYHPHLHVIFVVNPSYFTSHNVYISQKRWVELWKNALGVDYTPIVYISKLHGDTKKAVAEVAKYSVKGSDYLGQPMVLKAMFDALSHRKKCAFGGVFKDARKQIGLDSDEVSDELIHTDPLAVRDDVFVAFVSCSWNGNGYSTMTYGYDWE